MRWSPVTGPFPAWSGALVRHERAPAHRGSGLYAVAVGLDGDGGEVVVGLYDDRGSVVWSSAAGT